MVVLDDVEGVFFEETAEFTLPDGSKRFGRRFEDEFIRQAQDETRTIHQTLETGWDILSELPQEELDRVDSVLLKKYYAKQAVPANA